jgi:hypothetical protein
LIIDEDLEVVEYISEENYEKDEQEEADNDKKQFKIKKRLDIEFDFAQLNDEPISRLEDDEMMKEELTNETDSLLGERKKTIWENMQDKILSAFMSEDTRRALTEVVQLYQTYAKDLQGYSLLSILMACKLISQYDESNKRVTTGELFEDIDTIKEANHYWKFTSASFGWQFAFGYKYEKKLSGLISGFVSKTSVINASIVCDYCGIKPEDILLACWESQLLTPGYFLALDHSKFSIVVCIRGSFQIKDAIPDLIAHKVEFMVFFIFLYIIFYIYFFLKIICNLIFYFILYFIYYF